MGGDEIRQLVRGQIHVYIVLWTTVRISDFSLREIGSHLSKKYDNCPYIIH